ncbi:MAG: hypothetical protein H6623_01900 [Bdellovibrionaceae bacterium]|nr:hypothetical protein [Pseudobdellovibrionaceae bacterium]
MSTNISDTAVIHLTLNLLFSLGQFGLNPGDWKIQSGQHINQLVLVNHKDPEFRLLGTVHRGRWSSIKVLSI